MRRVALAKNRVSTVFHHHREELDDHLRAGSNDHLTFVTFLGVVDRFQRIGQDIHVNHDEDFSFSRVCVCVFVC